MLGSGWRSAPPFYVLNYDVTDLVVFCLPLFLVLAALLALGIDGGAGWLQAHLPVGRW